MNPRFFDSLTFLALLMALAVPTWGQTTQPATGRKPNPQPMTQEGDAPDLDAFSKAYKLAGQPRILVIAGIDVPPPGSSLAVKPPVAGGLVDQTGYVGQRLALFDPTGDSALLKSAIEEWLLADPDMELVDMDALAQQDRRQVELLSLRDDQAAIDLLGAKLNADLVLVVRMLNNGLVRDRGVRWRCTFDALQVGGGRKIAGFAFDWDQGVDAYSIKAYARAITRKFMDQFAAYQRAGRGAARDYTLRVLGLKDVADLRQAHAAFAKIPGVKKVTDGQFATDNNQSLATMNLRYAGSSLELLYELQQSGRELGLDVQGVDADSGALTLTAGAGEASPVAQEQRWKKLVATDDRSPQAQALREQLLAKYRQAGSPRIAVMVSRALTPTEVRQARLDRLMYERLAATQPAAARPADSSGVYVNLNVAGGDMVAHAAGDHAARDDRSGSRRDAAPADKTDINALLNTRRMEDALYKQMVRLGMTMVDPQAARVQVVEAAQGHSVFEQDDLVLALGAAAGADIVIQGLARMDQGRTSRGGELDPQAVSYTFRAIRVADGVTLAAQGWARDMPTAGRTSRRLAATPAANDLGTVADWIAGNLLEQMERFWTPPRVINVTLNNAKTQRDVFTVMDLLSANLPDIQGQPEFVSQGGDVGRFTIRYGQSYEELIKQIAALEQKLPIALHADVAGRDSLSLRIKNEP